LRGSALARVGRRSSPCEVRKLGRGDAVFVEESAESVSALG
jgi:hypothetical protein